VGMLEDDIIKEGMRALALRRWRKATVWERLALGKRLTAARRKAAKAKAKGKTK
jgi:hypothetical protein